MDECGKDNAEGPEFAETTEKRTSRVFTTEDTEGTEEERRERLLGWGNVLELGYFADG